MHKKGEIEERYVFNGLHVVSNTWSFSPPAYVLSGGLNLSWFCLVRQSV